MQPTHALNLVIDTEAVVSWLRFSRFPGAGAGTGIEGDCTPLRRCLI